MSMRRHAWLTGGAALALALTVCGQTSGGGAQDSESKGNPVRSIVRVGSEPEHPLVPWNTTETGGAAAVNVLFTGLVDFDPATGETRMANADSITPAAGNLKYTIKLKPGWKFHDGSPVNADSYVDAWNYAAYGPNAQSASSYLDVIDGYAEMQSEEGEEGKTAPAPKADKLAGLAKGPDDLTFDVTLKAPSSTFVTRLGHAAFSPLPPSFFDGPEAVKSFGDRPVGNGPFKFDEWVKGERIVLSRWADYSGPDPASIDRMTLQVYTDPDTAYQDLKAGKVDLMDQIPPSALGGGQWKTDLGGRTIDEPQGAMQYLAPTLWDKRYTNRELIRALSKSIDRGQVTTAIFAGGRTPADSFVPPVVPGHVANQCGDLCTFDPEAAR